MNLCIGIRNCIILYALIGLVAWACSGCTTILPQTYRVPLLITQDAMHRLPYCNINN